MSITTLTWKLDATGDGSTTTYTCAFPVMRVVDVKVYVDDVLQTMNRDYTITGIVVNSRNHVDAGFQVVFTEAPASGADILIRRKTPRHNSNKLYKGDKFQLPVFENNYDNIVMMLQELAGIEVTGFQTPIVNDEIYPTWYPIRSGFFSGKIVDITQAPKYKVQASVPTQGRLFTYQLPIIENEAADVNGRSDFSQGDDVLILPIKDSAGDTAWRFVGNAACNGGTPPYAGSYYNVTRCSYHTVNQIAYVRADEFSPGDVFIRNGVCYRVEATTDTPEDLSVVLRTSDVTMSTDCATCLLAVDPDTPDPPFQPTSYLRMARCEDDSMGEYSTPKEIMGIPVAEDLTKVYKLDGVCYYVTNNESATPQDPLFPMHQADVFNDCPSCEAPVCSNNGANCASCSDTDNLQYKVTFSGVNLCWPYCSGGDLYNWATGFNDNTLNTEHTLTQISGCIWEKVIPLAAAYITNSDQCGGASTAESTENVVIRLIRNGATWELQVELVWFSSEIIYLFQDTQPETAAAVCSVVPTFSNDNTTCAHSTGPGPGNAGIHGTGGTASVICL